MNARTIPPVGREQAGRSRSHVRVAAAPHILAILALEHVEKSFGDVRAVAGVSLAVEPGEILALLGPNGAGKTTLLRLALGMIRPDRGRVSYGFGGVAAARPDNARIGYLPEERGLYQDVPVRRYLAYFAVLRGMRRSDARREADRWLERLGLADRAADDLRDLSKGNQQKVQFISAIVHRPELAVLDEPFSGLDPLNQDLFLSLIRELRDAGTTVVLSAHQMQLVERLADRVVLIRDGRTAEAGTIEQLRDRWGAGRKLTLRVQGQPDVAFLETLAGVRGVHWSGADQVEVEVERDMLVSPLLEAIGSRLDVRDLKTEAVTLHDIYVRTVGSVDEPAEQVSA